MAVKCCLSRCTACLALDSRPCPLACDSKLIVLSACDACSIPTVLFCFFQNSRICSIRILRASVSVPRSPQYF